MMLLVSDNVLALVLVALCFALMPFLMYFGNIRQFRRPEDRTPNRPAIARLG